MKRLTSKKNAFLGAIALTAVLGTGTLAVNHVSASDAADAISNFIAPSNTESTATPANKDNTGSATTGSVTKTNDGSATTGSADKGSVTTQGGQIISGTGKVSETTTGAKGGSVTTTNEKQSTSNASGSVEIINPLQ
ncbi:hypothetical protein FACS1894111_11660 [Clostridia bacterium]|nr:hypothetical protein FACS1894111_11660 [Clostridia bacterium]